MQRRLVPEQFDPSKIRVGAPERSEAFERLGDVPCGGSPTAPVPARIEKGQVAECDRGSTEAVRELE
ncbi:MAG: hypothetical protein E7L00_09225 [Propionibacteriaceae bacterium]|nr:hypothetical protein [Propionibacteriaceae bacterium]